MPDQPELTYQRHLMLDQLLTAQQPVSASHDEMLFIIQHQTSELWMRLIIEELIKARGDLSERDFRSARKALGRVTVVFEQLVKSWDVLRTLTPIDFAAFRGDLGTASGFQSFQYRQIEFILGNRVPGMLLPQKNNPEAHARLVKEMECPSLYQVALRILAEEVDVELGSVVFETGIPAQPDPATESAWAEVYRSAHRYPDLFDLAECLVEIEDRFRVWRFNHVTTVERVIGNKTGTGGTSGVSYLRKMLDVEMFPDLWRVRSST